MVLEEEGLIWTTYLQFNSSWKDKKYNTQTHPQFLGSTNKLWEIMDGKGFPTPLITVQSMYQNTTIIIRKDKVNDNTPMEINKGIRQGCPLSLVLFNIYNDKVIKDSCKYETKYFNEGLNFKYHFIHR
jgi:hypothetical protein